MVDRKNMSRLSMNALCSGEISARTKRASTLSASRRVSKRSCNERWMGPYNRLIDISLRLLSDALGLMTTPYHTFELRLRPTAKTDHGCQVRVKSTGRGSRETGPVYP